MTGRVEYANTDMFVTSNILTTPHSYEDGIIPVILLSMKQCYFICMKCSSLCVKCSLPNGNKHVLYVLPFNYFNMHAMFYIHIKYEKYMRYAHITRMASSMTRILLINLK